MQYGKEDGSKDGVKEGASCEALRGGLPFACNSGSSPDTVESAAQQGM